jgi:hypothetical protein
MLSGTLAENPGSALLYGEPGYGRDVMFYSTANFFTFVENQHSYSL